MLHYELTDLGCECWWVLAGDGSQRGARGRRGAGAVGLHAARIHHVPDHLAVGRQLRVLRAPADTPDNVLHITELSIISDTPDNVLHITELSIISDTPDNVLHITELSIISDTPDNVLHITELSIISDVIVKN